jgi:excisionase family DNA binding protein
MPSPARPRLTRHEDRPRIARPATSNAHEKFMTIAELATNLDVSTRTVRRWIESGQLRAYRFERIVRIAPRDLDVFLGRYRVN